MSSRKNVVVAEFIDKYGDKRTIHRNKRSIRQLQLKQQRITASIALNRAAGVEIGKLIRKHRESAGMTLEELCVRAGLIANASPKARMWEIENCIRQQGMRIGTLYSIAKALNIPISELLPPVELISELADIQVCDQPPTLMVAS